MEEKYIKLKIEAVINKILYKKKIIDENLFENTSKKIDKLIWKEKNKDKKELKNIDYI